jgi:hypothetical protein
MERTKYPADLARVVQSEIKRKNATPSLSKNPWDTHLRPVILGESALG